MNKCYVIMSSHGKHDSYVQEIESIYSNKDEAEIICYGLNKDWKKVQDEFKSLPSKKNREYGSKNIVNLSQDSIDIIETKIKSSYVFDDDINYSFEVIEYELK